MISLILAVALVPQVQSYRAGQTLRSAERPLPTEGYRIRIGADGAAHLKVVDKAGEFYAKKTLKQILQ